MLKSKAIITVQTNTRGSSNCQYTDTGFGNEYCSSQMINSLHINPLYGQKVCYKLHII